MNTPQQTIEEWFSRRGWQPFDFQRQAWDAYLAGKDGLVHAPTGMGKTQAVWLGPVMEWLSETRSSSPAEIRSSSPVGAGSTRPDISRPDITYSVIPSASKIERSGRVEPAPTGRRSTGLRVLWITPLRALVNDTYEALRAPLTALNIPWTVESRTGDTASALRQRQRKRLPNALITTPESISLLLSYPETRENFKDLRAIVVDEWHELMSTKRGVQTELAMARLRTWCPQARIWGLSATLGNLPQAMQVLLGPKREGVLIQGDMPKSITLETLLPEGLENFPWSGHLGMRLLPKVIGAIEKARSTILFTNTRSQAELWYRSLLQARPDWAGLLALHHGSIDRGLRRQAERLLHAGRLHCMVATSSLDLGVDFSPVDQVIQVGGPKGIARLMQRAGRSGHQPGAASRIVCVPTNAFELVEFSAAREALNARRIESRVPVKGPLDVLIQHVVTIGLGGGFIPNELLDEVRSTHAFHQLTDQQWQWILDFVSFGGDALKAYPQYAKVREEAGRLTVLSREIARFHRMSIGTITSDSMMNVKMMRGGHLGTIEESFIAKIRPGEMFLFAGRSLELKHVKDMTAFVKPGKAGSGLVPMWQGGRMPLSTELSSAVRQRLEEAHHGHFVDAEMKAAQPLLELQDHWSTVPTPDELLIEITATREGVHHFLFPFQGRLVHEGLAALLGYRISRHAPRTLSMAVNDYGLAIHSNERLPYSEEQWKELLTTENLLSDLLASLNSTELARRRFRDIARVAGLIFQGYPGSGKSTRQIQASSSLFYDVFTKYDPGNLLLDQAKREVLESQLEFVRLKQTLEHLSLMKVILLHPERLTPFGFPLWAERLQGITVSSEKWGDRVRRMAAQLEVIASQDKISS